MTSRIPAAVLAAVSFIALGLAIARASCATATPCATWIAADAAARSHGILGFEVIAEGPRALDVRIDAIDRGGRWPRGRADVGGTGPRITGVEGVAEPPRAPAARIDASDAAARIPRVRAGKSGVDRTSTGIEAVAEPPRAPAARIDASDATAGFLRVRAGASGTEQTITGFGAPFAVRTRRDQIALGGPGAQRLVARRDPAGDTWSGGALDAGDAEALARVLALDVALAVQGSSLVFGGAVYASCTVRCTRAERCVHLGRPVAACADDVVVCAACLERVP